MHPIVHSRIIDGQETSTAAFTVSRFVPLGHTLARATDEVIADLVRYRRLAARAQGWMALAFVTATFAGIMALSVFLRADLLLGVVAALVALVSVGTGFLVERVSREIFLRRARTRGLSLEACEQLYELSRGVDGYIDVLNSCGTPPSDRDLATFVCPDRTLS